MPVWLANLLGGGLIDKILSFIPNPEEQAKAKLEMQKALFDAATQAESEQRAIDKVEAESPSLFVAGWRPAVGWLCVATLAYQWLAVPLLGWLVVELGWRSAALPRLDSGDTQTLLYALLGVASLRTAEKGIGVATRSVGGLPWLVKK